MAFPSHVWAPNSQHSSSSGGTHQLKLVLFTRYLAIYLFVIGICVVACLGDIIVLFIIF